MHWPLGHFTLNTCTEISFFPLGRNVKPENDTVRHHSRYSLFVCLTKPHAPHMLMSSSHDALAFSGTFSGAMYVSPCRPPGLTILLPKVMVQQSQENTMRYPTSHSCDTESKFSASLGMYSARQSSIPGIPRPMRTFTVPSACALILYSQQCSL